MRRAALAALVASRVWANTWAGGAQDPSSAEELARDATGELVSTGFPVDWPHGWEDVAGNGTTFSNQEQSADIRTAYGVCDAGSVWLRTYVSDPGNASANIRIYFFFDTDASPLTGGDAGADALPIQPEFTSDPSSGGYEHCLEVRGNGAVQALWQWNGSTYIDPGTTTAVGETGTGVDPILVNFDNHGYVQGNVPISELGLSDCTTVTVFIRSWNSTTPNPYGDTEIGSPGGIPGPGGEPSLDGALDGPLDASADGVPPDGGVPADGPLDAPGDRAPGDDGTTDATPDGGGRPDGRDGAPFDRGPASGGQPCTSDGDCGPGLVCHPIDLVCVDWFASGAGITQGGACSCRVADDPSGRDAPVGLMLLLLAMLARVGQRRP